MHIFPQFVPNVENMTRQEEHEDIVVRKSKTKILFIDDKKFDVVDILRNAGWTVKWIKDVTSLTQEAIIESDIIFVDIQRVGVKMRFNDEGLGLAKALKNTYPSKKIIIYSAETSGNRFHETLRMVDESIDKDSDPYIFEDIVERFSK